MPPADHRDDDGRHLVREQLADLRHEETADDHDHGPGERGPEDAGDAVLEADADGRADEGEAGAHHAGQADADRADALALDDRDDAGAQQRRVDEGDDLVRRQFQDGADDERHRDDAAERGEHVLGCKKRRGEQGRPVVDLVQQIVHRCLRRMLSWVRRGDPDSGEQSTTAGNPGSGCNRSAYVSTRLGATLRRLCIEMMMPPRGSTVNDFVYSLYC